MKVWLQSVNMTHWLKRLGLKAEFPPLTTTLQLHSAHLPTVDGIENGSLFFPVSSVNSLLFQGSKRQSKLKQNFHFSSTSGGSFSFYPIGLGPTCIGKNFAFSFVLLSLSLALCLLLVFPPQLGSGEGKWKDRAKCYVMAGAAVISQAGVQMCLSPSVVGSPEPLLSGVHRGGIALSGYTNSGWQALSLGSCFPGSSV